MTAPTERARTIGAAVEAFVRDVVAPYESDPRRDAQLLMLLEIDRGAPVSLIKYDR